MSESARCAAPAVPMPAVPPGWTVTGPRFKDQGHYLSSDGDNPEAPWPGYGWPLGTECYWYRLRGHGLRLIATGATLASASQRAEAVALAHTRTRDAMALADKWEAEAARMERAGDLDDPEIWLEHARQLRDAISSGGQG